MPFRHNKKRNIGLLSEFFSRYIANALVEKRYKDIEKAKNIWTEYVNPKTEIYKELSMFNALYNSSLKNKEICCSLMENVKKHCKKQNQKVLDEEKSRLINAINMHLKDPRFFDREIPNYKEYANVQILMNSWRGIGFRGTLTEIAQLEDTILGNMLLEKHKPMQKTDALEMTNEDIDGLVLKIMTEKTNAKFAKVLNLQQQQIIKLYVLSERNQDTEQRLKSLLENIRKTSEVVIKKTLENGRDLDKEVHNKLTKVLSLLNEDSNKALNDESIMFHMTLEKLKEEMST
jgi:hypothetical protein